MQFNGVVQDVVECTLTELAEICGVTRRAVTNVIPKLSKAGIRCETKPRTGSTFYITEFEEKAILFIQEQSSLLPKKTHSNQEQSSSLTHSNQEPDDKQSGTKFLVKPFNQEQSSCNNTPNPLKTNTKTPPVDLKSRLVDQDSLDTNIYKDIESEKTDTDSDLTVFDKCNEIYDEFINNTDLTLNPKSSAKAWDEWCIRVVGNFKDEDSALKHIKDFMSCVQLDVKEKFIVEPHVMEKVSTIKFFLTGYYDQYLKGGDRMKSKRSKIKPRGSGRRKSPIKNTDARALLDQWREEGKKKKGK